MLYLGFPKFKGYINIINMFNTFEQLNVISKLLSLNAVILRLDEPVLLEVVVGELRKLDPKSKPPIKFDETGGFWDTTGVEFPKLWPELPRPIFPNILLFIEIAPIFPIICPPYIKEF